MKFADKSVMDCGIFLRRLLFFALAGVFLLGGFPGGAPAEGRATGNPKDAAVVEIDGKVYTDSEVRGYMTAVLGLKADNPAEYRRGLQAFVFNLLAYPEVISEMPDIEGTPGVQAKIAKFKADRYVRLYADQVTAKKVDPKVEDVEKTLSMPSRKHEISVILCGEWERIEEARGALAAGEPFPSVARRFSEGLTAERGGKVGAVSEGANDLFTPAEFALIREIPAGAYSAPFRNRLGWAIVLRERSWEPAELRRMEAERRLPEIRNSMRVESFRGDVADLKSRAQIRVNEELAGRLIDEMSGSGVFPERYSGERIAEVNGRPLYAAEIEEMSYLHGGEDLRSYLQRRIESEIVAWEVERTGLDRLDGPYVDMFRKRAVVQGALKARMRNRWAAGEPEMRAYYEENRGKFARPETRRVSIIEVDSRDAAEEAARLLKEGKDFGDVASEHNAHPESRKARGEGGYLRREKLPPGVADVVFRLGAGEASDVLEVELAGGGKVWVIVKVTDIPPAVTPFEEVKPDKIRGALVAREMEAYHRALVGKILEKHKIRFSDPEVDLQGGQG